MTHQTSYNDAPEIGRPGDLVNGEEFNTLSRVVETAAGVGFGVPVARGNADLGCIAFAASTKFLGITRRDKAASPKDGDKFAQHRTAAILDDGVIFGLAGAALSDGGNVFWHIADENYVAAAGSGILEVPGCEYDSSVSDGEIVKIRVRKTTPAAA